MAPRPTPDSPPSRATLATLAIPWLVLITVGALLATSILGKQLVDNRVPLPVERAIGNFAAVLLNAVDDASGVFAGAALLATLALFLFIAGKFSFFIGPALLAALGWVFTRGLLRDRAWARWGTLGLYLLLAAGSILFAILPDTLLAERGANLVLAALFVWGASGAARVVGAPPA